MRFRGTGSLSCMEDTIMKEVSWPSGSYNSSVPCCLSLRGCIIDGRKEWGGFSLLSLSLIVQGQGLGQGEYWLGQHSWSALYPKLKTQSLLPLPSLPYPSLDNMFALNTHITCQAKVSNLSVTQVLSQRTGFMEVLNLSKTYHFTICSYPLHNRFGASWSANEFHNSLCKKPFPAHIVFTHLSKAPDFNFLKEEFIY